MQVVIYKYFLLDEEKKIIDRNILQFMLFNNIYIHIGECSLYCAYFQCFWDISLSKDHVTYARVVVSCNLVANCNSFKYLSRLNV